MNERKNWNNQATEAEILECFALDASSILRSAVAPVRQLQIVNCGQEIRPRRADQEQTRKEVPYGKNIVAG